MMTKSKLFYNAKKLGWGIEKDPYADTRAWYFDKCSGSGEDFSFTVEDGSGEKMQEEIRGFYHSFDAEDHARQNDGVSGAPDLMTLLRDALEIKEDLRILAYSEIHFEKEKRRAANKMTYLSPEQVARKLLKVLEDLTKKAYGESLFKKSNEKGLIYGIKDSVIEAFTEILSQYKEE